jgi:hypothetical protein
MSHCARYDAQDATRNDLGQANFEEMVLPRADRPTMTSAGPGVEEDCATGQALTAAG